MNDQWDALWINGLLATCEQGYGLIEQGAIAVKDGKIAWIGETKAITARDKSATQIYDLQGRCLTPGLIDCHTHLIFGGNRAQEFAERLQGVSYEDIARRGGGIQSTVSATRLMSEEELLQVSLQRAKALLASGVTTLEIKSGYGLDLATEIKILRVAKQIETLLPITIYKTFLGAHTLPHEYRDQAEAYLDLVCEEMLPVIAQEKLAEAVDVFCEKIAFNLTQTERVFRAAKQYGLAVKCHAEQLSASGSAALAVKHQALSVDHLEYLSTEGVQILSQANTVAVLLPGAFYFLRETQLPPITALRAHQVPIAIASDCNPGTSPILSLLCIMNMACTLFRLTPEEALLGVTQQAAKALNLHHTHGTLSVGKVADFAIWDVSHPVELAYYLGNHPLWKTVKNGKINN